jgi:hypothetical protein
VGPNTELGLPYAVAYPDRSDSAYPGRGNTYDDAHIYYVDVLVHVLEQKEPENSRSSGPSRSSSGNF